MSLHSHPSVPPAASETGVAVVLNGNAKNVTVDRKSCTGCGSCVPELKRLCQRATV